jgi:hypothetical protein
MGQTYFQNFTRDNGLPVTVEYSATGGEPDFDYPGHICDGGGSGPEIVILKSWPDTPWHNRLAAIEMQFSLRKNLRLLAWPIKALIRLDEWWRATLTHSEDQRFTDWLIEHYVEEPYEPEFYA